MFVARASIELEIPTTGLRAGLSQKRLPAATASPPHDFPVSWPPKQRLPFKRNAVRGRPLNRILERSTTTKPMKKSSIPAVETSMDSASGVTEVEATESMSRAWARAPQGRSGLKSQQRDRAVLQVGDAIGGEYIEVESCGKVSVPLLVQIVTDLGEYRCFDAAR
jgi:hypothetical protein